MSHHAGYVPNLFPHTDRLSEKKLAEFKTRLDRLGHWSKNPHLLVEARASLKGLRFIKESFERYLGFLQESISVLEDALVPYELQKGLDSLPDNVLSMIFEYVDDRKTLLNVSRRFHRVVSQMPQVWHPAPNCRPPYSRDIRESLKSKGVRFYVDLSHPSLPAPEVPCSDLNEFLDLVIPHKGRWKAFNASVSSCETDEPFMRLNERLSNLDLPLLKSFAFARPTNLQDGLNTSETSLHFYRTWMAPNLRKLHVRNAVPRPIPGAPNLASVKVEFKGWNSGSFSFCDLAMFLSSIPALEELHLVMDFSEGRRQNDIPLTLLPSLKSLRIEMRALFCHVLAPIWTAIITPLIHTMHFVIRGDSSIFGEQDQSDGEWLARLLCHSEYPTLQELYIKFVKDNNNDRPGYFLPFDKLPNLRTLFLDTTNMSPRNDGKMPALDSLCVKSCDRYWLPWLEDTIVQLKQKGNSGRLEMVTVDKLGGDIKKWMEGGFKQQDIVWINAKNNSDDKLVKEFTFMDNLID